MPSYLPHSRPTEAQRTAIADVAALMEVADENRADESLVQQEKREEDREWAKRTDDGADGSESASTIRILDQWREDRPRGVDGDDYLDETDRDQALLDELPGGDPHADDLDKRTARAVVSVAAVLRHGVVHDEDDADQAVNPNDYRAYDEACAADFPSYAEGPPPQAPPKPFEDRDDDGSGGIPHVIRRASSPPNFTP